MIFEQKVFYTDCKKVDDEVRCTFKSLRMVSVERRRLAKAALTVTERKCLITKGLAQQRPCDLL
jgi:hypothetical protein